MLNSNESESADWKLESPVFILVFRRILKKFNKGMTIVRFVSISYPHYSFIHSGYVYRVQCVQAPLSLFFKK